MRIISTSEPQDLCFHKRPMDGSCPECAENLKRNRALAADTAGWPHMDTCSLKYGGSKCTCGLLPQSDAGGGK